jgi:uncharacterized protein (DUF111 family)
MILGALIHLGADADEVAACLRGIGATEFRLRVNAVERRGVSGYGAQVEIIGGGAAGAHAHTAYRYIKYTLYAADIPSRAKGYALAAYRAIATAEAAAHGTTTEEVRFHEVGSPRALYTITAAAIAADLLQEKTGAADYTCGTLTDGSGTIECSHGIIPVPVPAVKELLKQTDIRLVSDPSVTTEMVTPSGLALLIGLGCRPAQDPVPRSMAEQTHSPHSPKIGYGFGTRDTGRLGAVRATLF